MSGRDFGRGDRGGFRDRDRGDRDGDRRGGFNDRGDRGGGFRDRDRGPGGFRDRAPGGFRDRDERGGPPGGSRPWEQRDADRPARPFGDRPFDRPDRAEPDRDVRVERYYEEPGRPPREDRGDRFARPGGDRPERGDFRGGDRGGDRGDRPRGDRERGGAFGREAAPPPPRGDARPEQPRSGPSSEIEARRQRWDAAAPENQSLAASPFVTPPPGEATWTYHHLSDSWRDEERLRGWTPSDDDLREMVEDNIEADPQLNARDRRSIQVQAAGGAVTLTGTVRSRLAKFAAGSDAYWTYGTREVRNDLTVRARGPQAEGGAQQPAAPAATAPLPRVEETAVLADDLGAAALGRTPDDEDAATTEETPAPKPKRASRAKAAPTVDPPAVTEADPTGIDNEGAMPPRTSPPPNDPHRGLIEPPGTTDVAEVRAIDAPGEAPDDQ